MFDENNDDVMTIGGQTASDSMTIDQFVRKVITRTEQEQTKFNSKGMPLKGIHRSTLTSVIRTATGMPWQDAVNTLEELAGRGTIVLRGRYAYLPNPNATAEKPSKGSTVLQSLGLTNVKIVS